MLFIKRKMGVRVIAILAFAGVFVNKSLAQVSFTNLAPSATIDFSNSMPTSVGTNTSTSFSGAGFSPNPTNTNAGRLNSNAWSTTGWSDGDLLYGGTNVTGDHARGSTTGAVTAGGFYAYTGSPASVSNPTLMIQPGGGDFEPGTLTLKLVNNGTTIITSLDVSYNLFVRNDQSRGDSLNFSYSSDNFINSDYPVASMAYGSPIAPDGLGWVQVGTSPSRSATLSTGVYIAPGSVFYLRWTHVAAGGSGSRDELGLDDINITATYSAPCTPPLTQATITSFSGVLSSQVDLNYTRGNGTGGVLIIASTSATLSSNPVSGVTYNANSNFGNGDPLGGGFVVYNGTANGTGAAASVTVTGLNPSTTYYFYVVEYGVSVPCYLNPANSGSQLTAAGSATSPTDYFRSKASGNWNNSSTWQSSPDNISWINATLKPTFSSKGILIQNGHTVTISNNETARLLTIASGATLTYSNTASGGYDLDIAADPSDIDLKVSGTYFLYGIMPTLASGATVQVYSGGLVRVDGNVGTNTSDDFARLNTVNFATGSVYQWNAVTAFQTSSATYFPSALQTDIATFRITQNIVIGASSTTNIQGLVEVNANVTLQNAGTKIARNGLIGTGTLTQSAVSTIQIDGNSAVLGGTGVIALNATGSLYITPNCVTTLTSNKTINSGTFTVDGTLMCSTNLVMGSAAFTLSSGATLGIGSPQGITPFASGAVGNIQVTNTRSYNTAANYIYNSTSANQVTGLGLPVTIVSPGSLTISNTGTVGNNTVTLTTNNTTTPTLNLANGLFEAGTSQLLLITATGTVNGTGGNQGISAAAGTIRFVGSGTINPGASLSLTNVFLNGGVNMGGGNTTIKGTLTIGASGFVNGATAPTYSSSPASTLLYNCGCNFGVGNEWYANTYGTSAGVPHHVTLGANSSANFGSANTPHEMRGDLIINNNSTLALSTASGGDLYIKGNWTRTALGVFNANLRAVKFNGTSGDQTITRTGGGTESFPYLIIAKATGQAVVLAGAPNATNVNVDGFNGGSTLQLIGGDIDLNQQTLNFTSYLNANQNNIGIDGTPGDLTRTIRSTGGTGTFSVLNSDAAQHSVTIGRMSGNASLLTFGSSTKLIAAGATANGCIDFGNTITTINGTFQINGFGCVSGNAPTYGTGANLVYNSGGNYDRFLEWSTASGPGYPYHVTVQNNSTLQLNTPSPNGDADRAMAGNLSIANGATLLLSTTASNKLTVSGNVQIDGNLTLPTTAGGDIYIQGNWNRSATGLFNHNDRAVFFNGSGKSTITANGGQLFPYLYLVKNAVTDSLVLLDDISISREFAVSAGTFDLAAKNATLKSDATNTADFGQVGALGNVAYTGVGRFIVERYIPTGTIGGQHGKSWQFLAVPDNGGQTINAGWQEGNVLPAVGTAGLGTIISSNIAGAGFDIIAGSTPALKTYDPVNDLWIGVANTASLPLYNKKGYFLFVRGDRTVTSASAPATTTTLRSTGKLFVPVTNPPPSTTVLSGKFESVGNPYASAINFLNLSISPGIDTVFYVWDPLLTGSNGFGGYQVISKVTGYKPTPGGTANYSNSTAYTKIQSGQAFFVHSTSGGGTVSFSESAKISGSDLVYKGNQLNNGIGNNPVNIRRMFTAQLYNAAGNITDANVVAFSNAYSNGYEANDALKMYNGGENFAIKNNNRILVIDARANILRSDTIQFAMSNIKQQTYQLRFIPENMDAGNMHAWLHDRFLGSVTQISLSDTTNISFVVNATPASAVSDRFYIVFNRRNRNAGNNGLITDMTGRKESAADIKYPGAEGIVVSDISVYPNPVVENSFKINFTNRIDNYNVQLINANGQVVLNRKIEVKEKLFSESIPVNKYSAGYYTLVLTGEKGTKVTRAIVIQ